MAYEYTIITYYGGEVLTELFNGISAAVGNQSYLTIIGIFSLFAFTWVAAECVFRQSFHISVKWFAGFFLLYNILLVPKVTVHIKDVVHQNQINIVQNVPWGLAEFASDIEIKTNGSFKLLAADDIDIKSTTGDVNIQANTGKMNIKSTDAMKQTSGGAMDLLVQQDFTYSAGGKVSGSAGGTMSHDATQLNEQGGGSSPASEAADAASANPTGGRND